MQTFLRMEIEFLAVIFLLIIFFNNRTAYGTKNELDQKLFYALSMSLTLVFILEAGTWFFDGRMTQTDELLNKLFTAAYYICSPCVPFFWILYADTKICNNSKRLFKKLPLYLLPMVINLIMVIVSQGSELFYYFDGANQFHRGTYWVIPQLLNLSYIVLAYTLIMPMVDRKTRNTEGIYYLVLLLIPPISGMIMQMLVYGVTTTWMGYLLSIILIYASVQNNRIFIDTLTGVYNREYIEYQLDNMIRSKSDKKRLFVIMIDMDGLKNINDTYGHIEGDASLISLTAILRSTCSKKFSIARFGGDEFVILGQCNDKTELEILTSDIEHGVSRFNIGSERPYKLSCSIGHAVFREGDTVDALVKRADDEMYIDKAMKKAGKKVFAS